MVQKPQLLQIKINQKKHEKTNIAFYRYSNNFIIQYRFRYPDNRGISYSSGGRSSNGGGSNNSEGGGKIIPREKPPTPDIQVRPSGTTLLKTKR